MHPSWKDSIYLQREQLAHLLREPLADLAGQCAPAWGGRDQLNDVLMNGFADIPHCASLYVLGPDGRQISDSMESDGLASQHFGLDRSQRPYMKEPVPNWGFLLSDAYISLHKLRPSLTALQVIQGDAGVLGHLGADFDLRNLPVTAELYEEPHDWRQVKGDPAIRGSVMYQSRVESRMDQNLEQALSILEELLTNRGVFQCLIHFSSSQFTIWTGSDPLRYRILDQDALSDTDICLVYPVQPFPPDTAMPLQDVARILDTLRALRMADENIYLRMASINIFNGMISLTFSCDGTHYMRYDEFLSKNISFWFGATA